MNLKNFLGTAALLMSSQAVLAVPFEPTFSDYAFPGSQYTVDTAANTFFSANYGITIDNAYLYRDGRDTFDGIGVSVGEVPDVGTPQTGTITFLDSTNFVSVDYWSIIDTTTYSAYDSLSNLVDSFTIGANQLGTHLFNAPGRISYLTWSSNGGFGQVTGLRYDYDGVTDGRNDDLPPTSVPEPSPFLLLGLMLAGLGFMRSKKA
jgi:hypothetical protein